jgi:hypothetical protein
VGRQGGRLPPYLLLLKTEVIFVYCVMKRVRHILQEGQRLFTNSGKETSFIFIKDAEYKKYGKTVRRLIEVLCNCGNKKVVQYNNIAAGHSVCCGIGTCKIPSNKGRRSIETSYKGLFNAYKRGAQNRGLSFVLTIEGFKMLIAGNCHYCNSSPSSIYNIKNSKTGETRAGIPIVYNGVDRVDNKIGYTNSNSVSCCEICNRMKMSQEYSAFLSQIEKIYNYKIKRKQDG